MSKRHVSARELSEKLNISKRTILDWCVDQPGLAFRNERGEYRIRLSELAKRQGMGEVYVVLLDTARWKRATQLAREIGWPRRTMSAWCRRYPWLAKRIGRIWYVDENELDPSGLGISRGTENEEE